jgi:hypothetical protein
MADGHQITRAADLTEADIDLLAADAIAVSWWCMRNRIKRLDQQAQVREALRARLSRRPLVIREWRTLADLCRAEGTPAIQDALDKVEQHIDYAYRAQAEGRG